MTTGSVPLASGDTPKTFMKRHPLIAYFTLAYFLAWITWIPLILSEHGLQVIRLGLSYDGVGYLAGLGTFTGPAVASLLVTAALSGRTGVIQLLSKLVRWRFGLQWNVIALFGLLPFALLGAIIVDSSDFFASIGVNGGVIAAYLGYALTLQLLKGPLGEEIGWRGFALPRLQQAKGPLVGTLILGILWSLWHVPVMVFIPAWRGDTPVLVYLVVYTLIICSLSIIMTWLYNNTGGSVLVAILLHAQNNSSKRLFSAFLPKELIGDSSGIYLLLLLAGAILLIIVTRGRLSYKPDVGVDEPEINASVQTAT